jgi:hypothetical protein
MKKPLTIALLSIGAIGAVAVAGLTYWELTAADRATDRAIEQIRGPIDDYKEGQQP